MHSPNRVLFLILSMIVGCASPLKAGTFNVFGPERFTRDTGGPVVETRLFDAPNVETDYILRIENGLEDSGPERVSSSIILLNGIQVVGPEQFNQTVRVIEVPVAAELSNVLEVELRGQPGGTIQIEVLGVDEDPPIIRVEGVESGVCVANEVTPVVTVEDPNLSAVTVNLDGLPFTSGTVVSAEGVHFLEVEAVDLFGNASSLTIDFVIDVTPPVVACSLPDGLVTAEPVVLECSCDDTNMGDFSIVLDGSIVPSGVTIDSESVHVVEIECGDCAGNESLLSLVLTLDQTPPTLSVIAAPPLTSDTTIIVEGTVDDNLPGLLVGVDGLFIETDPDGSFATEVTLVEGSNTILISAIDAGGLLTEEALEVESDTIAPEIHLDPFTEPFVNTGTTMVRGTIQDRNLLPTVSVNGFLADVAADGAFEVSVEIAILSGDLEIIALAEDAAGNVGIGSQSRPVFISAPKTVVSPDDGAIAVFPEGGLAPEVEAIAVADLPQEVLETLLDTTLTDIIALPDDQFPPGQFFLPAAAAISVTTAAGSSDPVLIPPELAIPNIAALDNSQPLWIFEILPDQDGDGRRDLALVSRGRISEDGAMIEAMPPEGPDDPLPGLFASHHPVLGPDDLDGLPESLRATLLSGGQTDGTAEGNLETIIRVFCCSADAVIPVTLETFSEISDEGLAACSAYLNAVGTYSGRLSDKHAAQNDANNAGQRALGLDDGQIDSLRCVADAILNAIPLSQAQSLANTGASLLSDAGKAIIADEVDNARNDPTATAANVSSTVLAVTSAIADVLSARQIKSEVGRILGDLAFDVRLIDIGVDDLVGIGETFDGGDQAAAILEARAKMADVINSRANWWRSRAKPVIGKFVGPLLAGFGLFKTCQDGADELVDLFVADDFLEDACNLVDAQSATVDALFVDCDRALDVRNESTDATATVGASPLPEALVDPDVEMVLRDILPPALDDLNMFGVPVVEDLERIHRAFDPDLSEELTVEEAIEIAERVADNLAMIVSLRDENLVELDPEFAFNEALSGLEELENAIEETQAEIDAVDEILATPLPDSSPQGGVATKFEGSFDALVGLSDDTGLSVSAIHTTALRDSQQEPFIIEGGDFTARSLLEAPSSLYESTDPVSSPDIVFEGANQTLTLDLVVDGGMVEVSPSASDDFLTWAVPGPGDSFVAGERVTVLVTTTLSPGDISSMLLEVDDQPFASLTASPYEAELDVPADGRTEATLRAEATLFNGSTVDATRTFSILRDDQGPTAQITTPFDPQVVEGAFLSVTAAATDNVRVSRVEIRLDGILQSALELPPFAAIVRVPRGLSSAPLEIRAIDPSGNEGMAMLELLIDPDPLTTAIGNVVDAMGDPLEGAEVLAFGTLAPAESRGETSDTSGDFDIEEVYTVTGDIRASAVIRDALGLASLMGLSDAVPPVPGGLTDVGTITVLPDRSTRRDYRSGSPLAVAIADFTGDGVAELVSVNSGTSDVTLFAPVGGGAFEEAMTVPVGSFPAAIAVGDLNEDGNLDFVTANVNSDDVSVVLGAGGGTFQAFLSVPTGLRPASVALADFDGDSHLDAVTGNRDSNNVTVLFGAGDGTFFFTRDVLSVSLPILVATADINVDMRADIVVLDARSNLLIVLPGLGDGSFDSPISTSIGSFPVHFAIGFVNDDPLPDVAVVDGSSAGIGVLLGNGDGTFQPRIPVSVASPFQVALADLDLDGVTDLAATQSTDKLTVFTGVGDGTFVDPIDYAVGQDPQPVALGDLNGDAFPDIMTGNSGSSTISVLLKRADGRFQGPQELFGSVDESALAVGDLDLDGNLDVVSGNGTIVSVFRGLGGGSFAARQDSSVVGGTRGIALGDLNGDDLLDVLTAGGTSHNLSAALGNGDGTFQIPRTFSAGDEPRSVAAADLDCDMTLDAVTADLNSDGVSVFIGHGNGLFDPRTSFATADGPIWVLVDDFNDDGSPDLATANIISDDVTVLLGDCTGTFVAQPPNPVGRDPFQVVAADFNGDGTLDLATANAGTDDVSVLLGNGDGTFQPELNYDANIDASGLQAGDLNDDGVVDLVVTDDDRNTVSVLLGLGDGSFIDGAIYGVGKEPRAIVLVDIDGDGRLDAAVVSEDDGAIGVLFGFGDGGF